MRSEMEQSEVESLEVVLEEVLVEVLESLVDAMEGLVGRIEERPAAGRVIAPVRTDFVVGVDEHELLLQVCKHYLEEVLACLPVVAGVQIPVEVDRSLDSLVLGLEHND